MIRLNKDLISRQKNTLEALSLGRESQKQLNVGDGSGQLATTNLSLLYKTVFCLWWSIPEAITLENHQKQMQQQIL